jgi:hypothetical protein
VADEHSLASSLNPDAGRHIVTTDERAIAAAEAAARRSYEEFPYYSMRYGERGRAFGLSDGAWLARLCELKRPDAQAQIRWLGGVLSARGMPQLLLERHLEIVYEELIGARGRAAACRMLQRGALDLRAMRLSVIPERAFASLARTFERRTGNAIPRFGELLVSAAADHKNGISNAVPSIELWATDPERFSLPWIEAVRETIAAAMGES